MPQTHPIRDPESWLIDHADNAEDASPLERDCARYVGVLTAFIERHNRLAAVVSTGKEWARRRPAEAVEAHNEALKLLHHGDTEAV